MAQVIISNAGSLVLNGGVSTVPKGGYTVSVSNDKVYVKSGSVTWNLDFSETTVDGSDYGSAKELAVALSNFNRGGSGPGPEPGDAVWGGITGTLSNQTDLQAALNGKATSAQGALADTAVQPDDIALEEGNFLVGGPDGNEKRKIISTDFGERFNNSTNGTAEIPMFNATGSNRIPVSSESTLAFSMVQRDGGGKIRINPAVANNEAVTLGQLNQAISSVYKFKGSVADEASLPSVGNVVGDVWNTLDTDMNFAWTGTEWDPLATSVDLTNYYNKTIIDILLTDKINIGSVAPSDLGIGSSRIPFSIDNSTWGTRTVEQNNSAGNSMVQRTATGQGKFQPAINADEAVTLGQLKAGKPIVSVSGSKTLALTDSYTYQRVTSAATVTIPTNASVAFPVGTEIDFFQADSGDITFVGDSGVVINSYGDTLVTDGKGSAASLKKVGTNEWDLTI